MSFLGCLSLDSYIKPQLQLLHRQTSRGCLSLDSYIKPQPVRAVLALLRCCLSLDSYIKPQLILMVTAARLVVYLLIPTSNHNVKNIKVCQCLVVYLLIPTSNHNELFAIYQFVKLFISWFLHQTTTQNWDIVDELRCLSLDSYIKPQPNHVLGFCVAVVYLLIPTSNHNVPQSFVRLYYVVYLLIPTSNHNYQKIYQDYFRLFISWFLHQTTTIILNELNET